MTNPYSFALLRRVGIAHQFCDSRLGEKRLFAALHGVAQCNPSILDFPCGEFVRLGLEESKHVVDIGDRCVALVR